jgi:hypothetical protein
MGCGSSMGTVIYQPRPHPCNRVQRYVAQEAVCFNVSRSVRVKKRCSPNKALKLTEGALAKTNANTQT